MVYSKTKLATFIALLATSFAVTDAPSVDAGEVVTVIIDAPIYDTRRSSDGGCDPAGCSGDLTRVSCDVVEWNIFNIGRSMFQNA